MITSMVLAALLASPFARASEGTIPHLSKEAIRSLNHGVFEVVVPKIEDKNIRYARALPFEKQSFKERTDTYHSIGTAFAISRDRFVSAAHVFHAETSTLWRDYFLRDGDGKVYRVGKFHRYSNYRDLVEFELRDAPEIVTPIAFAQPAEVGDDIFVVGNALGEGISFRGGQIASFTPEEVDGLWKFIRVSAPASPGNSGGPLVDSDGKVVGVILRRNSTENLNYAMPIAELAKLSEKEAEFYRKDVTVKDGAITVTEDFRASVPLPADLAALSKVAQKEQNELFERLVVRLNKEGNGEVFPDSTAFHDSMRTQTRGYWFGTVEKDTSARTWKLNFPGFTTTRVGEDQAVYTSDAGNGRFFAVIEKEKGGSLAGLLDEPKDVMDTLVRALGASRMMAGESVRILSYGDPVRTREWKDRLGRSWITWRWETHYDNTSSELSCAPVPKALACMLDSGPVSRESAGHRALFEHNIDEVVLSYHGTLRDWRELLALGPRFLPEFLRGSALSIESGDETGHLKLRLGDIVADERAPGLDADSVLTAFVGYSPTERLALELTRVDLSPRVNRSGRYSLTTIYRPASTESQDRHKAWDDLLKRSGMYSGKSYAAAYVNRVNLVLGDAEHGRAVASGGADPERRRVLTCDVETSDAEHDADKLCQAFARGITAAGAAPDSVSER
jgi:hypothetical protein